MPQNTAKVRPQIRSVRRGIAKDCALLLFSTSTDVKKYPSGRVVDSIKMTGTRQNGKTLSGTCRSLHQYHRDHVQGRDLEVGCCGLPLEQLTST